ncbi:hypothetical protein HK100_003817 [Physocladia obscura]|uniref:peptidylprolyl isomerase n=1 Tax=Physocladia obscura TaxID=109957 RepID=A0AAD5SUI1_9FUNG|nr:hypothetical protein HK100_003817 [Physocladia obscura]
MAVTGTTKAKANKATAGATNSFTTYAGDRLTRVKLLPAASAVSATSSFEFAVASTQTIRLYSATNASSNATITRPDAPWSASLKYSFSSSVFTASSSSSITDITPISPSLLAASSDNGTICLFSRSELTSSNRNEFSIASKTRVITNSSNSNSTTAASAAVTAIATSSVRGLLAAVSADATVTIFDPAVTANNLAHVVSFQNVDSAAISDIKWRSVNDVVVSTFAGRLAVLDTRSAANRPLSVAAYHDLRNDSVPLNCVAVHPTQNTTIATGNADGTAKIWDLRNTKEPEVKSFKIHSSDVWDLKFPLSNAFTLTTCSQDTTVANFTWNTAVDVDQMFSSKAMLYRTQGQHVVDAKSVARFVCGGSAVNSVDCHPDLALFVAVGDAGQMTDLMPVMGGTGNPHYTGTAADEPQIPATAISQWTGAFVEPVQAITNAAAMAAWGKAVGSEALGRILAVARALNAASVGRTNIVGETGDVGTTPVVAAIDALLLRLRGLVASNPPDPSRPRRYGDTAFRSWHDAMVAEADWHISSILQIGKIDNSLNPTDDTSSSTNNANSPNSLNNDPTIELKPYLLQSFGHRSRLDYGSGHELSFLCFITALHVLGSLTDNDFPAIALSIFPKYFDLVRLLQLAYSLEPAGSHGVWGLDDHQFLCYYWGSAQLINHPRIKPKSVLNTEIVDAFAGRFMYLRAIQFINEVLTQTKKGPFHEHSPMLYDISGVATWSKINSGMFKMYIAEVIQKFVVVQHLLFGSLLPFVEAADFIVPQTSGSKPL